MNDTRHLWQAQSVQAEKENKNKKKYICAPFKKKKKCISQCFFFYINKKFKLR